MTKRKNNRQKMETYRSVLTKVVKQANLKPREFLDRVKKEQEKEEFSRQDFERYNKEEKKT